MVTNFSNTDDLYKQAEILQNEGKYEAAIATLQTALTLKPKNPFDFYISLGSCLALQTVALVSAKGNDVKKIFSNAAKAYTKAVELQPHHFEALFGLGTSAYGSNQIELAQKTFEKLVFLKAEEPSVAILLAACHAAQELYQNSEAVYQRAVDMHPGVKILNDEIWARIYYSLARAMEHRIGTPMTDQVSRSLVEDHFLKAIELSPSNSFYYLELQEFDLRNKLPGNDHPLSGNDGPQ